MTRFYLPRHRGTDRGAEPPFEPAQVPGAERGETVLMVDHEATMRMLVTEVLDDLNDSAVEAAEGAYELRVPQADVRIDLLVTDMGLPAA